MSATQAESAETKQYTSFTIADRLYGIDVLKVQEVTRTLPIAEVPLAPSFVRGLINLRGQISTAICLRDLFQIEGVIPENPMNVVCREHDILISLLVDSVGDVLELNSVDYEKTPDTLPTHIKKFISGVYKTKDTLMSVVDIEKVVNHFTANKNEMNNESITNQNINEGEI